MVLNYTSDGVAWNKLLVGPTGPQGPPATLGNNGNWLINGDFAVNQRELTSVATNGTYLCDRWYCSSGGTTATISMMNAALGELPESSSKYVRITTVGQSTVADFSGIAQKIEDAESLSQKYATVSFWAKSSVNGFKVGSEFVQNFGTGGSATTYIPICPPVTIGTTWQRYTMTTTSPITSVTSKVLGANSRLTILIYSSAGTDLNARLSGLVGNQNGSVDFWGVQVEEGTTVTPFDHRTYADNLWECQRYFQRWKHPGLRGVIGSATTVSRLSMTLPVSMRDIPVLTMSGALPIYDGGADSTMASVKANYSTAATLEFDGNITGGTQYRPAFMTQYSANANYMDLSAEL